MKNLILTILFGAISCATSSQAEEVNNGTNPTLLSTKAGIQYQYTDFGDGFYSGLMELNYGRPFGEKKNMSLEVTVPFAHGPLDQDLDFGDVSFKFIHVPIVTPSYGAAYTLELFLDTAARAELGGGQTYVEASAFYARFLDGGSIFAPAVVHQFGLGDEDFGRTKKSQTTIDFYYVPKLPNPNYFMTLDPAIVHDWNTDATFGSLQVTMGMQTGKLFGGDSQIFIKPGVFAGGDRPADWSLQVGFKVLGF